MKPLRSFTPAVVVIAAALLAGCATTPSVVSDVSSFGQWPAARKPGSYVFERLPSQAARAEQQAQLEASAAGALTKAGFTLAADPNTADVTVQIGARVTRTEISVWDDPLWWRWGAGYWRNPGWRGSRVGVATQFDFSRSTQYEREVALLIRDRKAGTPLYETRASNDGRYGGDAALLAAMFEAALKDFPTPALSPRRVETMIAAPAAK